MRSRIEIDVVAAPSAVFELARKVPSWPAMLPHYRQVTVRSQTAGTLTLDMRAVRRFGPLPLPVGWRSQFWTDAANPDDLRLRFVHVAGPTRGMDVTWHITPEGDGARAAIVHDFERRLPLVGRHLFPRVVDRLFVRPIAGQTLATFKRLAEQAAQDQP